MNGSDQLPVTGHQSPAAKWLSCPFSLVHSPLSYKGVETKTERIGEGHRGQIYTYMIYS